MDIIKNLRIYSFSLLSSLCIIVISVILTKELNGIGPEVYSVFIFISAILNFAPLFELGIGGWIQNLSALNKKASSLTFLRNALRKYWLTKVLFIIFFLLIIIFLIKDYIPARASFGTYQDYLFISLGLGFVSSAGLALFKILSRYFLAIESNYKAYFFSAFPYVFSFMIYLVAGYFLDDFFNPFLYFLGFSFLLFLGSAYLFFKIPNSKNMTNLEGVSQRRGFFLFSLIGVLQLNFEILVGGWFVKPEDLANIGILQRVYFSVFVFISIYYSFQWRKFTLCSDKKKCIKLIMSAYLILLLGTSIFIIIIYFLRDFWWYFFSNDPIPLLQVHVLFMIIMFLKLLVEVNSLFLQAKGLLKVLNLLVLFSFLFNSLLYWIYQDVLDLSYILFIQASSYFVFLLAQTFYLIKVFTSDAFNDINTNIQSS